jgi:hypothetical protein
MATSTERMRTLREWEGRGLRRFTIGVSEDDLRVIAEHGYEGAASADHDHRRKLSASSSPTCSPSRSAKGNGFTTVATPFRPKAPRSR